MPPTGAHPQGWLPGHCPEYRSDTLSLAAAPRRRAAERGGRGYQRRRRAGPLLNDLIRPREHRRRDGEAQRLRRLQIDHQLELRRLLNGEVARSATLQDLVDVDGGATGLLGKIGRVGYESPRFRVLPEPAY